MLIEFSNGVIRCHHHHHTPKKKQQYWKVKGYILKWFRFFSLSLQRFRWCVWHQNILTRMITANNICSCSQIHAQTINKCYRSRWNFSLANDEICIYVAQNYYVSFWCSGFFLSLLLLVFAIYLSAIIWRWNSTVLLKQIENGIECVCAIAMIYW